jgi:hypothetical protein
MQIGFNFTLGSTLGLVQRLIREHHIDFCELLIDNFLHVPPQELRAAFDCPIGFHIMFSEFIEQDAGFLDDLAARLKVYIDVLEPIYVSDHLARFTHRGRQLYYLAELDYEAQYNEVRERVERWQDRLGRPLALENYPSIMDGGWDAPAFYDRLTRETGASVLFDASNAVCAQRNCGAPVDLWADIVSSSHHFHVAGYNNSYIEPHITVDGHDQEMASDTLGFLKTYRRKFDKPGATITYERDFNIDYDPVSDDLKKLRDIFRSTGEDSAR